MKRLTWFFLILFAAFGGPVASAQSRAPGGVIVRTSLGSLGLRTVCLLNGCTVVRNLDGNLRQLYLVKPAGGLLPDLLAATLRLVNGILDAEIDQTLRIPETRPVLAAVPPGLYDQMLVPFFGTTVWNGYANQPAAQIVGVSAAQNDFQVSGTGIVVADIDTGVDPNHPVLKPVLLSGYDFTRNRPGGSEMADLGGQSGSACNSCQAAFVNQSSAALLDQSSAALLDGSPYAAFGHGTEVMGVVHLVAPTAKLLPLKAFSSDGTGNLSNIINAVYYAVQNQANVINMSFSLGSNSVEFAAALRYATNNNLVCVASAGNDGQEEIVYPAALQQNVIGVASTDDFDQRSSFSNYGDQIVWVAAPGEQIVTTYPFGSYAAASGTSFSAPFVSGTASLLINLDSTVNQSQAESALTNEQYVGPNMGNGRLDIVRTLAAH
jgi:subtilisin family serine protease